MKKIYASLVLANLCFLLMGCGESKEEKLAREAKEGLQEAGRQMEKIMKNK